MNRRIVLVSGSPGSGKTTLAAPLAQELQFSLIGKDEVKETLHDALGGGDRDYAWSRRLGAAAFEVMWTLAKRCPDAMLEANFLPQARSRVRALGGAVVEVFCACPPEEAARRYAERFASTHSVHVLETVPPERMAEYRPLDVGPVLTVDTTNPVDVTAVAADILSALPR